MFILLQTIVIFIDIADIFTDIVDIFRDMGNIGIANKVNIGLLAKYVGLTMLQCGISVSPLKLQKILYYIQSWHMVFFGRENTLFAEAPHAWVNGPVYPQIYREYKNCVPGMCDLLRPVHVEKLY